jgi:hypothetical protein
MPASRPAPARSAIPTSDQAAQPAGTATCMSAVTVQWRTGGASWPPLAGTTTRQPATRQTAIDP